MSEDVRMFIEHYKKMVERNVMNKIDKDVMDFCRSIYRNHNEAIDLINRCTESIDLEINEIFNEIIDSHHFIKTTTDAIYFLPEGINLNYGTDKTWLDGSIVGLYFGKRKNNEFEFGISVQTTNEANNTKRNKLINALENTFGVFKNKGDAWRWTKLTTAITINKYCELQNINEAKKHIEQIIKTDIDKFIEVINTATAS